MADYVVVMYAGEIVEYDTVMEIFTRPMHPYTRGLLYSIPRMDKKVGKLNTIEGVVPSLKNFPPGCRFSNRCPECMKRCLSELPPLISIGEKRIRCWKYCEV